MVMAASAVTDSWGLAESQLNSDQVPVIEKLVEELASLTHPQAHHSGCPSTGTWQRSLRQARASARAGAWFAPPVVVGLTAAVWRLLRQSFMHTRLPS